MLQKIVLKSGVNRENTRLTNENGYYESEKVRFRQGTPEKIGGWQRISNNTYIGTCRSLWNWTTLSGANLMGVGTDTKFYIEQSTSYYDITPIRATVLLGSNPFAFVGGSATITVTDAAGGFSPGDYVTFYGATTVGGLTLNGEYQIQTVPTSTTYTITASTTATGPSGSGGGSAVYAAYQLHIGEGISIPAAAWSSGAWNSGNWGGAGLSTQSTLRIWTQYNFGENLIFGPKQGALYYWAAGYVPNLASPTTCTISNGGGVSPGLVTLTSNTGYPVPDGTPIMFSTTGALPLPLAPQTIYYTKQVTSTTFNLATTSGGTAINTTSAGSGTHSISIRAVPVSSLTGANQVPLSQYTLIVSDSSRFTIVFGTNDYLSTVYDPMLVRWSDQESVTQWQPAATNQSGSIRLSHGSLITSVLQGRQEILVWTDAAIYSLQYLGPPGVWKTQLLSDNISVASLNATAYASGVAYWMGTDKFYKYDGTVQTLRCDLRQYVFGNLNKAQVSQIFAGTNEGFNEIWWFYCSANSNDIDKYVIYNYAEDIWYYGSMARTAWLDTSLRDYPVAATYSQVLVNHEYGVNDGEPVTPIAIDSYITTSQFDIGDGHNFAFVYRLLPDLTFRGSTVSSPSVTMALQPLKNSGSGYTTPPSVGGVNTNATATVAQTSGTTPPVTSVQVDEYTGQIYIRIRARQMSMKLSSTGEAALGVQWQMGASRIDLRNDGRR
jgi:hypothetical protein